MRFPNYITSLSNLSKSQALLFVRLYNFLSHCLEYTQNCSELVLGCLIQGCQGGATLNLGCLLLELEQHLFCSFCPNSFHENRT
jgi:hypothetical protein